MTRKTPRSPTASPPEVDSSQPTRGGQPRNLSLNDLVIDPEYEQLLPSLTDEERAAQEAEFDADGVQDALVVEVETNAILDGMHRYRYLLRKYPDGNAPGLCIRFKKFPDREAAMRWIAQHQLGRRNLSDYHRVQLALQWKAKFSADAEHHQKAGVRLESDEGQQPVDALQKVAEFAGVGRDTVHKVEYIDEHGTPELKAAVENQNLTINAGAQAAKLPPGKQKKVAAASRQSKAAGIQALRQAQASRTSVTQLTPATIEGLVTEIHSRADELRSHFESGSLAAIRNLPREQRQIAEAGQILSKLASAIAADQSALQTPADSAAANRHSNAPQALRA